MRLDPVTSCDSSCQSPCDGGSPIVLTVGVHPRGALPPNPQLLVSQLTAGFTLQFRYLRSPSDMTTAHNADEC